MITFLTLGDFGRDTLIRRHNHRTMRSTPNVDAVLSLGDNFYNYGVRSIDDVQWRAFQTSFPLWCPFYAILGNHDYLGKINAQINNPLPYWKMPSRYYEKKFYFDNTTGGDGVHVFFLDTFTMSPHESRMCSMAMGMMDFDLYFSSLDQRQYAWLDEKLGQSQMTWKVVVGHYPIFSNGYHGNTDELVHHLLPILKKHKVDFYLSGHDHDLEFMRRDDIHFLVCGTGCSSTPVSHSHKTIYASDTSTYGFGVLEFTQKYAKFGFHTNNGKQMWYSVPKHEKISYS